MLLAISEPTTRRCSTAWFCKYSFIASVSNVESFKRTYTFKMNYDFLLSGFKINRYDEATEN